MFGHWHKSLTEYSNHYIDWSRVGEQIASGTHHYSRNEILVRGAIILFGAASGLLGAYLNDESRTGYGSVTVGIASGLLATVVAHGVPVYTLVAKRMAMRHECDELEAVIHARLDEMTPAASDAARQSVHDIVNSIRSYSLSNDKHGNASQTWGWRRRMLKNLADYLGELDNHAELLDKDTRAIIGLPDDTAPPVVMMSLNK